MCVYVLHLHNGPADHSAVGGHGKEVQCVITATGLPGNLQ